MSKKTFIIIDGEKKEVEHEIHQDSVSWKDIEEWFSKAIDKKVNSRKNKEKDSGKISDGYHTFDDLYYHRMILFSVICNTYKDKAFKSWKHADGTMYDNYFIVGIKTPEGYYTYHYHKDHWDTFEVEEMEFAPEWDGHMPSDITRLIKLTERNGE